MPIYPGVVAAASEGAAGVTMPSIVGTVTTDINSTLAHQNDSVAHTVNAGTDLLVIVILYGDEADAGNKAEATPTSSVDGNFTLAVTTPSMNTAASDNHPVVGVWYLVNPTAQEHTITWGVNVAGGLNWSGIACINLEDVDTADPIGDAENVAVSGATVNTIDSSIDTEKSNSLVIAWGAWQNGTAVVTADTGESMTEIALVDTGNAGTTDGVMRVATKAGPETPGNVTYGFDSTVTDDYAHGAVEIRGAG